MDQNNYLKSVIVSNGTGKERKSNDYIFEERKGTRYIFQSNGKGTQLFHKFVVTVPIHLKKAISWKKLIKTKI